MWHIEEIARTGRAETTRTIGFLLVPGFAMLPLASALEPMRAANRLEGAEHYRWLLLSADGAPVAAGNGIEFATRPLREYEGVRFDRVFVCAGLNAHRYRSAEVEQWLAARADDRTALGSLSTGTYLLARARVLRGYRCTIHWESLAPFREEFPELDVTYALYEIDRDRLTCSGGVAALDMILRLIWDDLGAGLARKVSMQFHHDRIRTPDDSQGLAERIRILRASPKLANAMELMAGHIEKPLPTAEIARRSCLSLRQLERQFLKHRHCTPQRYYLELRLRHARRLLLESRLSVLNVSLATGFASQSHFTKCYREQFGITPNRDRARAA